MDKIVVSICCITYNHEKYIRQCLEGLMNQKTNFKFEVLIHDDASLDSTASIVREYELKYPELIKPIYQTENQYSKGVWVSSKYNFSRAKGKYIAICEGDDYWTDPLKLQNQVDFLESNADYGMIYSQVKYFYQSSNKFARTSWGGGATTFESLIFANQIPTLSVVLRSDLVFQYINEIKPELMGWKMGDYPMWLYVSLKSKIQFVNRTTAVYRVLEESVSHSDDFEKTENFIKSYFDIKKFFYKYAKINYDKQQLQDYYFNDLASAAFLKNERSLAKSYLDDIKENSFKTRVKKIIYNSKILSFFYMLFYGK